MGEFKGFGPKALPFFKGLAFHQDKAWFEENRGLYESDVLAPFEALLGDLNAAFEKARIPLKANGRKAIFRIHRDVRFSKDKSPYKTHAGAVMSRTGGKNDPGLLYIQIAPDGCFAASGFYAPETADLQKLRAAIRKKAPAFTKLLDGLGEGGLELSPMHELTRVPSGFEDMKGGPLEKAIRQKSFIVEEPLKENELGKAALADRIADFGKRALPLLKFGWSALD